MTTSRRDFIKTAGVAAGVVALPSALPAWIGDVEAAEAAAAAAVDKNALADIALSTARKLGVTYADIRINRYRNEVDLYSREAGAERFAQPELRLWRARALQRHVGVRFESARSRRRRATNHAAGRRDCARKFGLPAQANHHGAGAEGRHHLEELL